MKVHNPNKRQITDSNVLILIFSFFSRLIAKPLYLCNYNYILTKKICSVNKKLQFVEKKCKTCNFKYVFLITLHAKIRAIYLCGVNV